MADYSGHEHEGLTHHSMSREEFAAARAAAEARKAGLSWAPEHEPARQVSTEPPVPTQEFAEYTGHPDGSFTVLVTMQRGNVVVSQSESGSGSHASFMREAYEKAYKKAERALVTLIDSDKEDDDDE